MLVFEKIQCKNFLSTGNNFLELQLNTHKTTVFQGESGQGKSILNDALAFVLFNRAYRNISKTQLVNSINNKDCVVELVFTTGNKKILVRRGIKPNIFEIFIDDKLVNQDAHSRDYQAFLENQILKFNYEAFNQIVVLGASGFTPFMKLKSADRRSVIEELLGLQIFSTMNDILKEKINLVKEDVSSNQSQKSLLVEKIKFYEEQKKESEKNTEKKKTEIQTQIDSKNLIIDLNRDQSKKIEVEVIRLSATINENKNLVTTAKYEKIKDQLEQTKERIKEDIKFYSCNDSCPTCKQNIDDYFRKAEVKTKETKLKELDAGIEKIDLQLKELEKEKTLIDGVKIQIRTHNSNKDKCNSSIWVENSLIQNLQEQLNELNAQLQKPKEESKIESLNLEVAACETKNVELIERKTLYETAHALLKDSGIKSQIIKNYLPVINKYLNKYLQDMNFYVKFMLDENFGESVKTIGLENFTYGNFSEGERQRIDLATLFTWRTVANLKNSVNTNLLVLDEVLDSALDLNATENVIGLLNTDTFQKMNIFVVSHKNLKDKFAHSVEFIKKSSFTQISK